MNTTATNPIVYPFLKDTGEIGQLIAHRDWSSTSIGHIEQWPLSLQTTLANMLHSAFPMLLFWGKDLTCFYNSAFRPSLGKDGKHPGIGKKGKDLWADVWEFSGPLIQKVMAEGKPVYFEDQLVPFYRDGKTENIYWTFSYSPAFGDDGKIAGVLVICMETTQQVIARRNVEDIVSQRTQELASAHASLLQANAYLQQIINLFKEPLQVLEPIIENGKVIDFRYKLTNAAYSAYANATPDELRNKKVGELFPGYFQTSSFANVVKAYETGNPDTWEIHYEVDGLNLYNEMSATKFGEEVVVHFTDFTKLKNLQLDLMRKIEELERSNQNLEEFAHAASHDLKEPIRKIQIFIALLKKQLGDKLNSEEITTFQRIESATQRMGLLVEDLLLYSHVSYRPLQQEDVDLNQKLQRVLEDLELYIQEKKAVIHVGKLPVVKGYRRQLQQLFQNLVSNALKYCKSDVEPQINIVSNITTLEGKKYHLIQVKDNGIGFEQEYSERIFQMFTRLHGKNEYSGTGIGLSIVKKVIENHKGFIKTESKPGAGATFKVYLPAE